MFKTTDPRISKLPFLALIVKVLVLKSSATSVSKSPLSVIEVPAVILAKIVVLLVELLSGLAVLEPSIFLVVVKVGVKVGSLMESGEPIFKAPVFLKVAVPEVVIAADPIVVISEKIFTS